MSAKEYMRLNKDNSITLNFNKYRGKGFVDAIKVRDIANVRILGRDQRENIARGGPDVELISADGSKRMITRQELISRYTYVSGKKIRIRYMKNNVKYNVLCNCNVKYGALLLPSNMNGYLNGKSIPSGVYLVAPKNEAGEIEYEKVSPVSRKWFRKMFKIPMQHVIKNNIDKGNKESNIIKTKGKGRVKRGFDAISNRSNNINTYDNNAMQTQLNNNPVNNNTATNRVNNNQMVRNNSQIKYPFKAVGRIVNQENKLLGFIILDLKGNRRKLDYNAVKEMCRDKKVQNLTLVTNEYGTEFIRGNGVVLNSIPQFLP